MSYIVEYMIYLISGSMCSYFSCVFLLPYQLQMKQRLIVFTYICLINTFFYRIIGQTVTFLAVGGAVLLILAFTKGEILSTICSLWGYLYSVTFNYLFQWLISVIFNLNIETMFNDEVLAISFAVSYCIYCGVTIKRLGNFIRPKLKEIKSVFRSDRELMVEVFLYMVLITFLFIFNISYGDYLGYSYGMIALSGIIFLMLFMMTGLLIFTIYRKTLSYQQMKSREAQYENSQRYTKKLEESYSDMRRFKHDYLNILITLECFISDNDMPALSTYFYNKIMPTGHGLEGKDTKLDSLSRIENMELKSLVSSKLIYSIGLGVYTEIEVKEQIIELFMDSLDLARVLGIFLDNAIEAALETDEKLLKFCMTYKKNSLVILVQNTSIPLPVSISEINQPGISGKGENRGIGLANATELLEKYSNVIWDTNFKEPFFTQCLTIENPG
ncbi:signal transduction protein with a C-terminal ATPase domain [Hungatella hathewayi]|nr:signal transduction protein with a C-terminal ATPase domain [Hungatella hathewayi]